MPRLTPRYAIVALSVAFLLLGGCGTSKPSRFYLLTAMPRSAQMPQLPGDKPDLAVGLGPVTLPPYLDRPQIVTHASPYQLHMAEFDQWAEPLHANVTRVLAENLSTLLATDRIAIYPWQQAARFDFQVVVNVMQFVSIMGVNSALMARWVIYADGEQTELMRSTSSITVPVEGSEYSAIAAAMSQAVGELSRNIAVALRAIAQNPSSN
jgi:uncharacterized lipoprotein YmbA